MHRTEGANNLLNRFTDGPPSTCVEQNWLNAVQEEMAYLIEQAGFSLKTVSTETHHQLYESIMSLISSAISRGYIDGLILGNSAGDPNHDIDMATGVARNAGNDAFIVNPSAAWTKAIDANWAQGNGGGGLPAALGGVGADTWYHCHALWDPVSYVFDWGYDTSLTAANLLADVAVSAAGFTKYRRVGSVLTNGASDIIAFSQYGDEFLWKDPPFDVDALQNNGAGTLRTLSIPIGLKVWPLMNITSFRAGGDPIIYISSPDVNDEIPSLVNAPLGNVRATAAEVMPGTIKVRSNTSSQVRSRSDENATQLQIVTLGWIDPRGRDV